VNGFLLDTHVLLWFIQKDPQLSNRAREVIADDANLLFLSIASLWEIAVKINIGKLKIGHSIDDLYRILAQFKLEVMAIEQSDLNCYLTLPLHHRDPFDRLLIAQAIARDLILVSADSKFEQYPVQQLW
jgi:PIN domain nuclease of toxin-antitoxin system